MKCILDRKTGATQPWHALQLAAYTLLDTPVEFKEEGHVYTFGKKHLPSVTGILKSEGFIDDRFFDDYSRNRGSMVHLACHLDDINDLDEGSLDPAIIPYLTAWRLFKKESGFIVEKSEQPRMSSAYQFAGTPDCIGYFPESNLTRCSVELHNNGTYKLIPFKDRNDIKIWLSILACYFWKQNNLKGGKR